MYPVKSAVTLPAVVVACRVFREQFAIAAGEQPTPPEPSVQLPTLAYPLISVVADVPVALPPPPVTVKVTDAFGIGARLWSSTRTRGAVATAAPEAAV